jgi:tetrapyrrole methylase family protein/MazG family protein
MGRLTVVGLGPAGPEHLTTATREAIADHPRRYLRTRRHPSASAVEPAESFDHHYEAATTLDEVYERIAADLAEAAEEGDVLYAVPGSPAVAERSVELVRRTLPHVVMLPALSFVDLAWDRLGVDPIETGVRLVDGHRFAAEAAGERGPLLVAQCDDTDVLSRIKLAVEDGAEPTAPVVVLQRLGLPDESVAQVAWADLDRAVAPDHLTSLWIPELATPVGRELVRFAELVRTLRERCPWDREQTHQSLTRHLLEETHEVLEAIAGLGEPDGAGVPHGIEHLEEELGDLLFQVYFHATIAAETGGFTLADVARGIHDKLVRRHPHVFGDVEADSAERVMANWEQIKKIEKGRESLMDGIAGDLPALLFAHKVQRKAATVGFDWDGPEPVYAKVIEELCELIVEPTADELGDVLFSVVNLARHLGHDPEASLRGAAVRFRDRFGGVERLAAERGISLPDADLATLDALWDEVKAEGAAVTRAEASNR